MSSWTDAKIIGRHEWAPGLITLKLGGPALDFEPGQFTNLGLELGGELVRRSYSLASAPGAPPEFYLTRVHGGELTPALFDRPLGATLRMDTRASGFFTLDHVPEAVDIWLLCTGTGLGPYIAMLRSDAIWQRFERIVLVHGVRRADQLGYHAELTQLAKASPGRAQLTLLAAISREPATGLRLTGRIPSLIESGALEQRAAVKLDAARSHVLLCGNPNMIRDTTEVLGRRGLKKHRRRAPGQITAENYW